MASMRRVTALIAAGVGVAACDQGLNPLAPDSTLPDEDPFGIAKLTRSSVGGGNSPYGCAVTFKTPNGPFAYAYRRIHFGIPKKDLAPDESKMRYVLHVEEPGEDPVATAYCVVPNTGKALAFLNKNIAHQTDPQFRRQLFEPGAPSYSTTVPIPPHYITASPDRWYGNASQPGWQWDDGSDWDSTAYDAGGGGAWEWNPDLTPPPECFPNTDSLCLTDLRPTDRTNLTQALNNRLTPLTSIADTALRTRCEEMASAFQAALNATNPVQVHRGAFNTAPPGAATSHSAATGPGTVIHFDPWLLDSAATGSAKWQAELANSALHEAAHVLGHDHGEDEGYNLPWVFGTQYLSDWFKDLNWYPQAGNGCIQYP